jgi:hypothetical protein
VVLAVAVLPEWLRKMTRLATIATSTAATITGTSGRRERRGPPEPGANRRSPSIAVGGPSDGTGAGPSTRVASGSAGGGGPPPGGGDWNAVGAASQSAEVAGAGPGASPGGTGHGCGPDGDDGRRGAYQESQGEDSGASETTGNGAVDDGDGDGDGLSATDCPHTGQNRAPGCTGCPHAGLPEPATPAIVTAG